MIDFSDELRAALQAVVAARAALVDAEAVVRKVLEKESKR